MSCLCWLIVLGCQSPGGAGPARPEASAVPPGMEKRWQAFLSQAPAVSEQRDPNATDWWADVILACHKQFWLACREFGPDVTASFFAQQFGQSGTDADFRVLFAEPEVMVPQEYTKPVESRHATNQALVAAAQLIRKAQLAAARAQVELFLDQPEQLHRYYQAALWCGLMFRGAPFHHLKLVQKYTGLKNEFRPLPDSDYWWYARDFMVLAYATCSEDLLGGATPGEMYERFLKWKERIEPHIYYVLPLPDGTRWGFDPQTALEERWTSQALRRPEQPFPTWDAKMPPPRGGLIEGLLLAYPPLPVGLDQVSE